MDELAMKILFLMFAMAMFCNVKWPKNYILHGFWIIMVAWVGVNLLEDSGVGLVFPLSIMLSVLLINSGYMANALKEVVGR